MVARVERKFRGSIAAAVCATAAGLGGFWLTFPNALPGGYSVPLPWPRRPPRGHPQTMRWASTRSRSQFSSPCRTERRPHPRRMTAQGIAQLSIAATVSGRIATAISLPRYDFFAPCRSVSMASAAYALIAEIAAWSAWNLVSVSFCFLQLFCWRPDTMRGERIAVRTADAKPDAPAITRVIQTGTELIPK